MYSNNVYVLSRSSPESEVIKQRSYGRSSMFPVSHSSHIFGQCLALRRAVPGQCSGAGSQPTLRYLLSLSLNLPHNSTAAILTRRSDRTGTHVSASPHNRTRTTQSRQSKSRHPPACTSTREPHLHMRTDQPPGTCRLWSVCSWRQA